MTQAVVEGPIGKEVAVLGATRHHVFRWLWWQHSGTWRLGQGLVACGWKERVRLQGYGQCLLVFAQLSFLALPDGGGPFSQQPLAWWACSDVSTPTEGGGEE